MRLARMLAIAALLVGCGGATSPAGPLGDEIGLTGDLPASVRVPASDATKEHAYLLSLHGVDVKLSWRSFEDGRNAYIQSYRWEVVKPAPGVLLRPSGNLAPVNTRTPDAVVHQQVVRIRWETQEGCGEQFGDASYFISADGTAGPTLNDQPLQSFSSGAPAR